MSSSDSDEKDPPKAAEPLWKPAHFAKVRELFKKNFYNMEYMEHVVSVEKKLIEGNFEATLITFDKDGEPNVVKTKGPNKAIFMGSYNQLACPEETQPPGDAQFEGMLVKVGEPFYTPKKPEKCCANKMFKNNAEEMVEKWSKTDFFVDLEAAVKKFAPTAVEDKSVACFGLGRIKINADILGRHAGQGYLQHYAASRIRDWIAEAQGKPKESIPIYAQDPAYCSNCKEVLQKELGITVVPGSAGFLKVNGNSFVVTKAADTPVRQIVGDLTRAVKGPAGMLCDPLEDEGDVQPNGRINQSHPDLYKWFVFGAVHSHKMKVWNDKPGSDSDESLHDSKALVEHKEYLVKLGTVFDDIALYFKDKKFG